MTHRGLLALLLAFAVPAGGRAADQTVLGRQLLVKNTTRQRKIVLQARENETDDTIVGDPTVGGAELTISVYGGTPSTQTFPLPPELWSRRGTTGFTYEDPRGGSGPVRRAKVKLSRGRFRIKAVMTGDAGSVDVVPPDPGSAACAMLGIDGGDSYSVRFGQAKVINKGSRLFKVKRPTSEGTCIRCGNGFLDAGEQCDPAGPACSGPATCQPDCTCLYTAPAQPILAFDEQAAVAANGAYPAADPATVCGADDRRFLAELVQGSPLDYKVPLRLADIKPAGSEIAVSGAARSVSLGGGDFPFDHTYGSDFNMDVVLDGSYAEAAQRSGVVTGDLHVELAEGQFPHANRAPGPASGQEWEEMSIESRQGIHTRFIPDEDARVAVMGHWIVDCGHLNFQTELHPLTFMANARVTGPTTVVDAFYNPYRETQLYHMDPAEALDFDDATRFSGPAQGPFPLMLILSVLRLQDAGPAPYQSIDHLESWAMLEPNRDPLVPWHVCAPPGSSGRRLDVRYHWVTRPGVAITVTPDETSSCAVVQVDLSGSTVAAPVPRVCVAPWAFLNEVAGEEAGVPDLDLQAELGAFIPAEFQSRLDPDPILNCYDPLQGPAPESPPLGQRVDVDNGLLLPFYGTISVALVD